MYAMPRLSLYKPEKGNDYRFMDKVINEQFTVGGTDIYLHKYLGPYDQGSTNKDGDASPSQPQYSGDSLNERTIQDLLFLENRDRKYSPDVYILRGIYNVQDMDFNLSQFGMFLQNDTVFMTVHLNDTVERIGRKIMSGDVIELPHMKDDFSLDENIPIALKRFYVVEDVNRAAEGFSQTWWPHLLRLKLKSIVDSQEYRDILEKEVGNTGNTLASYMSTYNREKEINTQVVAQAEADAPKSGFNYKQYYVTPIDERGNVRLDGIQEGQASSNQSVNAVLDTPASSYYGFYIDGDGIPPNGYVAGHGTSFPSSGVDKGDYFLRTDYLPNRLFRYDGTRWVKVEDAIRLTTTNNDTRSNYKTQFINNTSSDTINGLTVQQRQSLSDALKPKADD